MLDLADLGTNPHAAEFDGYGLCQVRHGKGGKGSPPKRRSVLTVWPWLPEVLGQWIDEARPLMAEAASSPALWPSERGPRVGVSTLNKRFDEYRDALGMEAGLDWPPRGCSTPPTWSRCWQTGASTCPRGKSGGWSPAPPERLSLPVLAALCDIFEVTPAQLIAARAENIPPRKAASCGEGVTGLNALRPRRAHLKPPAMTSPRRRTCARCGDNCGGSAR